LASPTLSIATIANSRLTIVKVALSLEGSVDPDSVWPEKSNMNDSNVSTPDVIATLHNAQAKLADLIPRLDEANRECAEVVRLLDDLSNLDVQQRQDLAQRIRRAYADRDAVTELVDKAFASLSRNGDPVQQQTPSQSESQRDQSR
jgi:murein DD-endopeptidase MepM/ murein hydrolase activator NlpD